MPALLSSPVLLTTIGYLAQTQGPHAVEGWDVKIAPTVLVLVAVSMEELDSKHDRLTMNIDPPALARTGSLWPAGKWARRREA